MSHLVSCSAHDVFPITGESDRMPRCTIDEVLKPMQWVQESCQGMYSQDSESSVSGRENHTPVHQLEAIGGGWQRLTVPCGRRLVDVWQSWLLCIDAEPGRISLDRRVGCGHTCLETGSKTSNSPCVDPAYILEPHGDQAAHPRVAL